MKRSHSWFERFDAHRFGYIGALLFTYLLINNGINATSVWMEHSRNPEGPGIALWEPFVWEYTSAIGTLLVLPLAFYWFSRFPIRLSGVKRQLVCHLTATVVFSVLHIAIMVALREVIYTLAGGNYEFGDWASEFFYEYRKDAWSYVFWLMLFYSYRFIYSRLKGEASLVDASPDNPVASQSTPEHLLVRKLDREFLVPVPAIEWLESAGNYVNLHADGRIYPLRASLSGLIERLEPRGFSRVHRSFGVNHQHVASIEPLPSGDADILLKSGHRVALSRRYKDAFKQKLR